MRKIYCEGTSKIRDALRAAYALKHDNLNPSQTAIVEELISKLEDIDSMLHSERKVSEKLFDSRVLILLEAVQLCL